MTQKIKVMRIITRLNIGGPARHAIILNEGLEAEDIDTILVTGSPDENEGDMTYLAKEKGLKITTIPELGRSIKLWGDVTALWRLFRIIRKERPDIVHTHTAKAGALGRCAAVACGVPVKIHSFHGHVFHDYFSSVATKIFIFIEKILACFTNRVIVISEIVKGDICNRFKIADEKKVSVIRLGLDLEKFKDIDRLKGRIRKELNINVDMLLIGIVGRLTAIKNHKLFLDAAKLIKDENPAINARFLIIGDGELRSHLETYASDLGIEDLVCFTGWRGDLANIYADLDIVVLTSLNEGTPLSLIEAMASGKAVMATRVGGVPDLVKDNETGLLVDSNNPAQLKEAMVRLVSSGELRNKLGDRASERVCAMYSKDRLVSDMKKLYKELIRVKQDKEGEK